MSVFMGLGSMYHSFDKVNALQMTGNKGEWREFMQRLCTNTFRLYPHKYVGRETKKKENEKKVGDVAVVCRVWGGLGR